MFFFRCIQEKKLIFVSSIGIYRSGWTTQLSYSIVWNYFNDFESNIVKLSVVSMTVSSKQILSNPLLMFVLNRFSLPYRFHYMRIKLLQNEFCSESFFVLCTRARNSVWFNLVGLVNGWRVLGPCVHFISTFNLHTVLRSTRVWSACTLDVYFKFYVQVYFPSTGSNNIIRFKRVWVLLEKNNLFLRAKNTPLGVRIVYVPPTRPCVTVCGPYI